MFTVNHKRSGNSDGKLSGPDGMLNIASQCCRIKPRLTDDGKRLSRFFFDEGAPGGHHL